MQTHPVALGVNEVGKKVKAVADGGLGRRYRAPGRRNPRRHCSQVVTAVWVDQGTVLGMRRPLPCTMAPLKCSGSLDRKPMVMVAMGCPGTATWNARARSESSAGIHTKRRRADGWTW